jgi:hypothetical protein
LEKQLQLQLDQYQCLFGRHYDESLSTVEAVLCHYFGKSKAGNWHREAPSADQTIQFQEWEQELKALPALQVMIEDDWCARSSESWPNEEYKHELEWFTNKAKDLHPTHHWNVASTAVSLCCFLIWLCFSPHRGPGAEILDQTCEFLFFTTVCVFENCSLTIFGRVQTLQWVAFI